jgi:glycosyltransferase involved in cell wall biosynthesis
VRRGCPESKIRIVMNSPDESIFVPQPPAARNGSSNGKFNIMYHGLIAERHGLAVALEAVQELAKEWPGLVLNLYGGRNSYTDKILSQAKTMALNGAIQYHGKRKAGRYTCSDWPVRSWDHSKSEDSFYGDQLPDANL